METGRTITLGQTRADIERAAGILRSGGLVAFPTETVYGLGADATSDLAVAGIFAAKDRPRFNPLIVHLAEPEAARDLAEMDHSAERLADAFWPGPLTLVLPLKPDAGLSALATAGLSSVGLRCPAHPVAHALLTATGRPVAAPSANPSGKVSPVTAAHVLTGLDGRIDAVVDGGRSDVGLESTIIGLTDDVPRLLRPGGIPAEEIEAALGRKLMPPEKTEAPNAPGQLASHYAPGALLRLNATDPRAGETFIGFGPGAADFNLSPAGDLREAAANLFPILRELDASGIEAAAIAPIPNKGLGTAINDRLARAAAPRPSGPSAGA